MGILGQSGTLDSRVLPDGTVVHRNDPRFYQQYGTPSDPKRSPYPADSPSGGPKHGQDVFGSGTAGVAGSLSGWGTWPPPSTLPAQGWPEPGTWPTTVNWNPASGGGMSSTGGSWWMKDSGPSGTMPAVSTGPAESPYLANLEAAIKARQAYEAAQGERSFAAQAAASGLAHQGGWGDAYARYRADRDTAFAEALANPVWQSYESEQGRLAELLKAQIAAAAGIKSSEIGASAAAAGAETAAGAARYGDELRYLANLLGLQGEMYGQTLDYNLGLQGLGLQQYGMDQEQQRFLLGLLQALGPEAMLSGLFGNIGNLAPGYAWQPGRGTTGGG